MPPHEMRIPDGAREGPHADEAVELARIWWVHDRPEYILSAALKDPRNVGRVLYEAAFHFSQVYASHGQGPADETLKSILAGFEDAKGIKMATMMTRDGKPVDPAQKG